MDREAQAFGLHVFYKTPFGEWRGSLAATWFDWGLRERRWGHRPYGLFRSYVPNGGIYKGKEKGKEICNLI